MSASKRCCAEPGCGTLLSQYGNGRWCWLHEPHVAVVERVSELATVSTIAPPVCRCDGLKPSYLDDVDDVRCVQCGRLVAAAGRIAA